MTIACTTCGREFAIAIWETNTEGDWVCRYCLQQEGDNR